MITQITNVEDVATFAQHLIHVEKLSVHPDDDFADYTKAAGYPAACLRFFQFFQHLF